MLKATFFQQQDIVRVVILEVHEESQRLLVGMRYESLSKPLPEDARLQLGFVHPKKVPRSYTATLEVRDRNISFDWLVEKSVSFLNPTGAVELAAELGLPFKAGKASLFSGLIHSYPPESTASALRKEQTSKMALGFVSQGIKYFKEGSNIEAFQCLNKALTIDKDNVEALVARGALFANNGQLDKAIADFEAGLAVNPEHRNAKKYLCQTLIAVGKNYDDDQNFAAALEAFEKALQTDPADLSAQEGVWVQRQKVQGVPPSLIRQVILFTSVSCTCS